MSAFRATLFLLPFLVAIVVSLLMAAYALRRRNTSGAFPFALAMVFQALWVIGYALELAAAGLEAKLLLDDLQWFFAFGWASFTLAFITAYAGKGWIKRRHFWVIVTAAPIAFLALLVTNRFHGLIRTGASIAPAEPFPVLDYPISPAMLAVSAYLGSLYFFAVVLLGVHAARQHRFFRRQSLLIMAGTLVPAIGGMLSILEVRLGPYRDFSPFTFTVSAVVIGFGLLRYKLFRIGPVAREVIFQSVVDPILVFDPLRRLVDANIPAITLLGASGDEIVGRPAEQILAPYPELLQRIEKGSRGEWSFLDPQSGSERQFDVTLRDIKGDNSISYGTLVMLHELTEIRAAQAQLVEAQEELARRERFSAVGKLLSKVAHDLRNPMMTLRASLHTVQEATGGDGGEVPRAAISRAEAMVTHLEGMTEELLDFGGKAPVRMSNLDLEVWVRKLLGEYEPPKGVSILSDVEPGLSVSADPLGLRRALLNLLSNAADATTECAGSEGRVTLTARRLGGEVSLAVSDDGVGIPKESIGMVFEPLYTTKVTGMGLGMSIVRDVVDSHRGRLEIDSSPGNGTTVSLILPANTTEIP